MILDTANNLVYGVDQITEFNICSLNYVTNAVTLYDTGISEAGTHLRPGIDSNGNVFMSSNHSLTPIIVKIDPSVPEATTWTLTGLCCAWQTTVDQNDDVWIPTFYDLTSATFDDGLVRLNQTTNLVTQWDFNYIGEGIRSTMTIDADGDLWVNYDGSSGSTNDHILQFFE